MGFSVSGATVVVFAGLLVSVATLYPAVDTSNELRRDAIDARDERALELRNTDIEVTTARFSQTLDELTVVVENTGTTTLSVDRTTLLVDGVYRSTTTDVAGGTGRTVWAPGEELTFTDGFILDLLGTAPTRVKVVTEFGVADASNVTVVV